MDFIVLFNKIEVIVKKFICFIFFIENCLLIFREIGIDKFWVFDNLDNSKFFNVKLLIFFRCVILKCLFFNFLLEFFKILL